MADFTVNTTTTKGGYFIVDAYSADVGTSTELVATSAGNEYLLKSITVTMKDTDGKWFKVFDDTTLRIGPVSPYNRQWHRSYESPIRIAGAINIQTEANRQIHITIAYTIRTTTLV